MSQAVFPTLPGLTWKVKKSPRWSTVRQASAGGAVVTCQNYAWPLYDFELTYSYLSDDANKIRQNLSATDLRTMEGFFNSRSGGYDTFYVDLSALTFNSADDTVTNQLIGIGNGTTTTFQLYALIDPSQTGQILVQAPKATPTLLVNGAAPGTWNLEANGVVQFATAPANNAQITASFSYYIPCRFAEDTLEFAAFAYLYYECQTVKLTQAKFKTVIA